MFDNQQVIRFLYDNNKMDFCNDEKTIFKTINTGQSEYYRISKVAETDIELYHITSTETEHKVLTTDILNLALIASYFEDARVNNSNSLNDIIDSKQEFEKLIKTNLLISDGYISNKFFIVENNQNKNKFDVGFCSNGEKRAFISNYDFDKAVKFLSNSITNYRLFDTNFHNLVMQGILSENERMDMLMIYICGRCPDKKYLIKNGASNDIRIENTSTD